MSYIIEQAIQILYCTDENIFIFWTSLPLIEFLATPTGRGPLLSERKYTTVWLSGGKRPFRFFYDNGLSNYAPQKPKTQ